MARPESPELATIDDTLASLIGIRIAVAIITDRSWRKLTAEDRAELDLILDLTNRIQADHLHLRQQVSKKYQLGA